MRFFFILITLLAACSSNKREYHPPANSAGVRPQMKPESGEVMSFTFDDSPSGSAVTGEYVGSMLLGAFSPFSIGANSSHIPTYHIRLGSGRIVHVRDPDAPLLARGSRVLLMPGAGGHSIIPDTRRH